MKRLYIRFIKWLCAPALYDTKVWMMAKIRAELSEQHIQFSEQLSDQLSRLEKRFDGKLANVLSASLEASSKIVHTANKAYAANTKAYVNEMVAIAMEPHEQ